MNSKNMILLVALLSGCSGESSSDSEQPSVPQSISVQTGDTALFVNANKPQVVDVSQSVFFTESTPFKLKSVELAKASENRPECRNIISEVNQQSFIVEADTLGLCMVSYSIAPTSEKPMQSDADFEGNAAIRFIGEQQHPFEAEVGLPVILKDIGINTQGSVDLKQELAANILTGFNLQGEPVIIGSGMVRGNIENNIIEFSEIIPGQTSIYYQLISGDNTEVKFGSIVIVASEEGSERISISDIEIERTALEEHLIDVATLLPDGESLEGLQLVDVVAFADIAKVVDDFDHTDPASMYNTKFILNATLPGNYLAALVFSDHKGGNVISSASIKVVNPFTDIVVGDLVFSAPFTVEQADYAKLGYVETATETGTLGPNLSFPLYDWNTANNVCLSLGAYLPSTEDLVSLFTQEGSVFDGSNKRNWPASKAYWSASVTPDSLQDSSYQAVNLDTGSVQGLSLNPEDNENKAYLTCVVLTPQSFAIEGSKLLSTGQAWAYTVSFTTLSGQVYNYTKPVLWSSSDDSVLQIDNEGNATAIRQGKVTVTAQGVSDDFTVVFEVEVIALPDELKVEVLLNETTAGSQRQFNAIGYYDNGETYDFTDAVTWSVNNSSLARVYSQRDDNTSGILKAFNAGRVNVTASLGSEPSTIKSKPYPFTIHGVSSRNTCYPLRAENANGDNLFFTCNLTAELAARENVNRDSFVRTGSEAYSIHMPVGRNESFYSLNQARAVCDSLAEPGDYWVPKATELAALFEKYDGGRDINHKLYTVYDWSTFDAYNTESIDPDGIPLIYNLSSAVTQPNGSAQVAMTSCVTDKVLAAGVGNGFSNNFSFNPIVSGIPANNMMRSTANFGDSESATVRTKGFIYEPFTRAQYLVDKMQSKNPPQLVVIGYDQHNQFNSDSRRQAVVDFLKRGGAVFYMNQSGDADEMIEAVFDTGDVFDGASVGSSGAVFQFRDIEDPVLNGSFGKLQNEYWGTDRTSSEVIKSKNGLYPEDMVIYSTADDVSGDDSKEGVTALRHKKYKFIWVGDAGFLGGRVGQPDPTANRENPFAYRGDFIPAKNTQYGRGERFDVSNSIFYANFLEWVLNGDQ